MTSSCAPTGKRVGAGPLEGILGLEELGVDIDGAAEVEAAER